MRYYKEQVSDKPKYAVVTSGIQIFDSLSEAQNYVSQLEGNCIEKIIRVCELKELSVSKLVDSSERDPSIGDIIQFGKYPQSSNILDPIEWVVLKVDSINRKMLLISKKIIDCQQYNSTSSTITWETCSLRVWLNTTFFNTAFSESERSKIITTMVENPTNQIYSSGSGYGNVTRDKIFCLSLQEANSTEYFTNPNDRMAEVTTYAYRQGVTKLNGYSKWWLRTQGRQYYYAAYINANGEIDYFHVNYIDVGVRPVLWVNYL